MDKYIELLKKQIEKLNDKDFDLESWKNRTIIVLGKIFGDNNQKIKQIEKIDYNYGSWSLRDTTGNTDYMDSCKKLGKVILDASINELETFGLPEKTVQDTNNIIQILLTAIEDELTGGQFKEIKKITASLDSVEEKRNKLMSNLKSLNSENLARILSNMISDPEISKAISI